MVKRCAWETCNTDSRYPKRLVPRRTISYTCCGKKCDKVDVAQASVNFSEKAVVNTPTDVEKTVTDIMEEEEQNDKTKSSTVTCEFQVSKIVYLGKQIV